MQARHRKAIARVAAPLAFLVLGTLGVVAVRSALHDSAAPPPPTVASTATETTSSESPAAASTNRKAAATWYRVEAGDTLETIASRNATTVEQLLQLNPGIDPVALRIGQRIRVG